MNFDCSEILKSNKNNYSKKKNHHQNEISEETDSTRWVSFPWTQPEVSQPLERLLNITSELYTILQWFNIYLLSDLRMQIQEL